MPVERVTRLDDRRLAEYRNIRDSELLRRRGLFMAVGPMVVERLLDLAGAIDLARCARRSTR